MPHRSESGKIITSKTPLLSSHATKISSSCSSLSQTSAEQQQLLLSSNRASSIKMKNKNNATNNVAERKLSGSTDVPTSVLLKNGQQEEHQNGLELQGSEKKESNGIGHSNMINGYSKSSQQTAASNEQATAEITGDNQNDTLSSSLAPSSMGLTEQRTEEPDIEKEGDEDAAVSGPDSPSLKNGFLHFHPQIKEQCDVPCRKDFIKTLDDSEEGISRPKKIYRVVLTGGPCGGKTTGQARLCTFFENLGWKVYRVPEAATVLLGGGIKFGELNESTAIRFQEELLRTMMQIESVFFRMAETVDQDVLIICDRGTMDASAFIKRSYWEDILARNNLNEVDIRDTRYNQIIHMVSAANGAEPFYTTEDHICRSEGISLARHLDKKAAQAWVGHPYFDVVDNSTDFESKVCRMIQCVCQKLGIDVKDRLETNAKKVKFLVKGPLPECEAFPSGFQDFTVVHDYLQTNGPKVQARLRKRGQKNHFSYTYTVRRPELQGQVVEVKTTLTQRDYNNMLAQRDHNHVTVYKNRRCFLLNNQYFQLDVYKDPCHPRCKGLILLETYSTLHGCELHQRLPKFLNIAKEVTGDPRYSMFNLSLKDNWMNNKYFCQSLSGAETRHENRDEYTKNELHLAEC